MGQSRQNFSPWPKNLTIGKALARCKWKKTTLGGVLKVHRCQNTLSFLILGHDNGHRQSYFLLWSNLCMPHFTSGHSCKEESYLRYILRPPGDQHVLGVRQIFLQEMSLFKHHHNCSWIVLKSWNPQKQVGFLSAFPGLRNTASERT